MARIDITEYSVLARDNVGNPLPCGQEPALVTQPFTSSGSSQQSAAFGSATRFVRIHAAAKVHLAFGPDPTASTSSMGLSAGGTEIFGVTPGHKVAFINGA